MPPVLPPLLKSAHNTYFRQEPEVGAMEPSLRAGSCVTFGPGGLGDGGEHHARANKPTADSQ